MFVEISGTEITVPSSPPEKFVFMSWEVIITMSGTFTSHWSKQDGDVPVLQKIQQGFFNSTFTK